MKKKTHYTHRSSYRPHNVRLEFAYNEVKKTLNALALRLELLRKKTGTA